MRIISGKYKGRILKGFDIEGTRPTMDRVKESLFAIIFPYLKNSECLDLFAGSGSLGLEAISNGCLNCTFVDNNIKVLKALKNNTKDIDNCILINSDFKKYLETTNQKFDIIFIDPPYARKLVNTCLEIIKKRELLKEQGIIVCEYEQEVIEPVYPVIKEKKYGTTKILIQKKER